MHFGNWHCIACDAVGVAFVEGMWVCDEHRASVVEAVGKEVASPSEETERMAAAIRAVL